ncbi:uncharacterized protein LOC132302216 [Cornus florida]|uniref:uncharacterized protein LOC132302216 n=1 Tax=Cornus florida TaxID=4283 RepID=UPI00289E4A17|nr:uncharacterized protein LOC132302216 [Cornus florida]
MSQPVQVYPKIAPRQTSSHSNGSFGTVFMVLAAVVGISVIACIIGRLCNQRQHHGKTKQNHTLHTKEGDSRHHTPRLGEGDIEFGFRNGIPAAKQPGNGHGHGHGHSEGYNPSENNEIRGETRFAHDNEIRASA